MTLRIPDRRFLSTPSARRATIALCHFVFSLGISIHALREEGDFSDVVKQRVNFFISIHALREEGDVFDYYTGALPEPQFLSTPSARRATFNTGDLIPIYLDISIHALREEGDGTVPAGRCRTEAISIHALREEGDTMTQKSKPKLQNFYPPPPRGGRRDAAREEERMIGISIHALREEGDLQCLVTWSSHRYFYPRPPRGGRPMLVRNL